MRVFMGAKACLTPSRSLTHKSAASAPTGVSNAATSSLTDFWKSLRRGQPASGIRFSLPIPSHLPPSIGAVAAFGEFCDGFRGRCLFHK